MRCACARLRTVQVPHPRTHVCGDTARLARSEFWMPSRRFRRFGMLTRMRAWHRELRAGVYLEPLMMEDLARVAEQASPGMSNSPAQRRGMHAYQPFNASG